MTRRLCLMFAIAACADQPTNGLPQPGPPGGDDVWTGTSEITLENVVEGFSTSTKVTRADVTWTFDDTVAFHVPSGTLRYTEDASYDNSPNPPCVVTARYEGPIDPSQSSLFLDDDSYVGVGIELTPVTVVDSCNGTMPTETTLNWFGPRVSMGVLVGNSIDFEGTEPAGSGTTQTSRYHFER